MRVTLQFLQNASKAVYCKPPSISYILRQTRYVRKMQFRSAKPQPTRSRFAPPEKKLTCEYWCPSQLKPQFEALFKWREKMQALRKFDIRLQIVMYCTFAAGLVA